jgi:DNA-binding Lrp family transcriptional regulator
MDRLLSLLQEDIPIVSKPYLELGRRLGIGEEDLIEGIKELRKRGLIRQISPIFDTRRAGYDSSLVAFSVSPERIEEVAALVSSHPGVSHNYERNHEFNLWFTLAVPPDAELSLEETVKLMAEESRVDKFAILRTVRTFKIGVKLNFRSIWDREEKELPPVREVKAIPLSHKEKLVIRYSQEDLPLIPRPFEKVAGRAGILEEELLETLRTLKSKGVLRRFSAILYHRRAGFKANGMIVWKVQGDKLTELAEFLRGFRSVSHCYERSTSDVWEYSLFSMVHGRSKEEVEEFATGIAQRFGVEDFLILYSSREFKKRRIRLFSEEFYVWEKERLSVLKH